MGDIKGVRFEDINGDVRQRDFLSSFPLDMPPPSLLTSFDTFLLSY
jgi:hypothetical protein